MLSLDLLSSVFATQVAYMAAAVALKPSPVQVLLELRFEAGASGVRCAARCDRAELPPLLFEALPQLLA